jgi:hypothetical protein
MDALVSNAIKLLERSGAVSVFIDTALDTAAAA